MDYILHVIVKPCEGSVWLILHDPQILASYSIYDSFSYECYWQQSYLATPSSYLSCSWLIIDPYQANTLLLQSWWWSPMDDPVTWFLVPALTDDASNFTSVVCDLQSSSHQRIFITFSFFAAQHELLALLLITLWSTRVINDDSEICHSGHLWCIMRWHPYGTPVQGSSGLFWYSRVLLFQWTEVGFCPSCGLAFSAKDGI